MELKPFPILSIAIGVVAFVFYAASAGGNSWVSGDVQITANVKGSYTLGLFKMCAETVISSKCIDLLSIQETSWLKAVRAFMILAVLITVTGVTASILAMLGKMPSWIAGAIYIVAALFGIIGVSVYAGERDDKFTMGGYGIVELDFAWSFILGCLGICLACFASIVSFVAAKQEPRK